MKRIAAVVAFMCIYHLIFSQSNITGIVTNDEGEPLAGANVYLEDFYTGTITDENGYFHLKNLKTDTYILKVSFIGFTEYSHSIQLQDETIQLTIVLQSEPVLTEEVIIKGIRANEKTPVTTSYVDKEELLKTNLGQDMPYLLAEQPSIAVTSDAGNGIGYTGMRIRGSDARKINVTINGIPLNDAESHGVFWVDIPDISGSTNSIQIQRGVGTSTNGTGAFGASVNINTDNFSQSPYILGSSSWGSFNTRKYSVGVGTGLINDHWFLEAKASKIASDGYRDRAWSDMKSYFVQSGFYKENTLIKLVAFGGWEETYQAWYGVDSFTMGEYGRTFNWAGAYFDGEGNMKFYDNFIDHYQQDHIQLHIAQALNEKLKFNLSLHYTYGRGYYEEFYQDESLEFYGIEPLYTGYDSSEVNPGEYQYFYHDTIYNSDVVRRLWLDNDFYGGMWALHYVKDRWEISFGGSYNIYGNAKHYGEIRWLSVASDAKIGDRFYENTGDKKEFNSFAKILYSPLVQLSLYGDIQIRNIHYRAEGLDREYRDKIIDITRDFSFVNPKIGIRYQYASGGYVYSSYAIANREPTRSDMVDAPEGTEPRHETLYNLEFGIRQRGLNYYTELVLYHMNYRNELVLTGELNGVGTPIRENIGSSYRMGCELTAGYSPWSKLNISGNITLSKNKTDYTENISDSEFITYKDVDISFSPGIIAGGSIAYQPLKNLSTRIIFKHVGKQYLDNTGSEARKLDPYTVTDILVHYSVLLKKIKKIDFSVRINNIFNLEYNSNGSLWDGIPQYYPQAGINYLAGINVRL